MNEPKKITKAFIKHVMKEFENSILQCVEVAYEQGKKDGRVAQDAESYLHTAKQARKYKTQCDDQVHVALGKSKRCQCGKITPECS